MLKCLIFELEKFQNQSEVSLEVDMLDNVRNSSSGCLFKIFKSVEKQFTNENLLFKQKII